MRRKVHRRKPLASLPLSDLKAEWKRRWDARNAALLVPIKTEAAFTAFKRLDADYAKANRQLSRRYKSKG